MRPTAPAVPPLAVRSQPGLSETLDGPRDPRRCQCCSTTHSTENPLARWLEHDAWDRVPDRQPCVVVLCQQCSRRVIEPHPRLYRALAPGEPFPGCMSVCLECIHRIGVQCAAPTARVNGGPGVQFTFSVAPLTMHACGGHGARGWQTFYGGRVSACSAFAPASEARA